MDLRICRLCGKTGQDFLNIFNVVELKSKIETTLPLIVSPHSLLPDTICKECTNTVENFYIFKKTCLQNLIILESHLDIKDSCLKSKRKHEKSCSAKLSLSDTSKFTQTEDYLDVLLGKNSEFEGLSLNFPLTTNYLNTIGKTKNNTVLVNYDIESESDNSSDVEEHNYGKVVSGEKLITLNKLNDFIDIVLNKKSHFTPHENLIEEIAQKKKTLKRKSYDVIEQSCPKICKLELGSRRKSTQPKKLEITAEPLTIENTESVKPCDNVNIKISCSTNETNNVPQVVNLGESEKLLFSLPQSCLMCDTHFPSPEALATHIFEVHHVELSEIVSSGSVESVIEKSEKRKKTIPNLVKISDLRRNSVDDSPLSNDVQSEDSPSIQPSFVCPNCPAVFVSKNDVMLHLRLKHPENASYLCGLCLYQATTYANLKNHLMSCSVEHTVTNRYVCKVCCYGDDNFRWLEHHVLVHEFLLDVCRKECRIFDPAHYVEKNEKFLSMNGSPFSKMMSCTECGQGNFETFKDFSSHRRTRHSIFHCDLCNKFYGRNSHLWKHVNRLHKGHPSITCQMCYKTSASKYHLAQHFKKIHTVKMPVKKILFDSRQKAKFDDFVVSNQKSNKFDDLEDSDDCEPVLNMAEFDESKSSSGVDSSNCCNSNLNNRMYSENEEEENSDEGEEEEEEVSMDVKLGPKEIDATHDLYTNIITNYTRPTNEGDFKCPKCYKAFHKRVLLRKHKKNCRPRMQKDLLTRCKSCARIFKDRQSLAKHLVNYHSDYVCEICHEKVQSKCEIVSHIRFQHVGSHLVCHLCENVLRSRADFEEHLRNHDDSFICQFCGDSLPSKVKLKMHILSLHRAILSLSCGICLRLFENQYVLRDHVTLMHKDRLDPLTSCPVCGKNYGSKWKTYDHLNKSHGRIFRACKICLEIFNHDTELEMHTKTSHVNVPPTNNIKNNCNTLSVSHITSTINDVATNHSNNNNNNCDSQSEQDEEEDITNGHWQKEEEESDNTENEENVEVKEEIQGEEPEEDVNRMPFGPFSAFGQKLNNMFLHENRMSLLEKRLVGKKVSWEKANVAMKRDGVAALKQKQVNIVQIKREKSLDRLPTLPVVKKEEDVELSSITNSHITSSKRTVYVNSNDPSKCEICNKTWPAKKHLWQHYIRCHKSVAATVCGICLKSNPDYFTLQIHLRTRHPNLLYGQGYGSNFICRVCGRYHNASSKLKLHMVIHENFDWGILDRLPPLVPKFAAIKRENHKIKQEIITNGHYDYRNDYFRKAVKKENEADFDENYLESLIEEEEYFSHESDRDSERERAKENDVEDSNGTSIGTKLVAIEDMEGRRVVREDERSSSSSSSSDDSSNSSSMSKEEEEQVGSEEQAGDQGEVENKIARREEEHPYQCKDINTPSNDVLQHFKPSFNIPNMLCNNIFSRRPEELDSAIKSISMECLEPALIEEEDDYCDIQTNFLNDREIESAVGSIL